MPKTYNKKNVPSLSVIWSEEANETTAFAGERDFKVSSISLAKVL